MEIIEKKVKYENLRSIFYSLFFIAFTFVIDEPEISLTYYIGIWIATMILAYIINISVSHLFPTSIIQIDEVSLIQGFRKPFASKLKVQVEISKMDFKGFEILQNDKKHFVLYVLGKNGSKLSIYTHPNRNPTKAKLEELKKGVFKSWINEAGE